uniref:Uncharacterized protein n=1 Tax=Caenorhabditis tropicalis TaxID=1561998 RepID=A0A1I7UA61_9PELO
MNVDEIIVFNFSNRSDISNNFKNFDKLSEKEGIWDRQQESLGHIYTGNDEDISSFEQNRNHNQVLTDPGIWLYNEMKSRLHLAKPN